MTEPSTLGGLHHVSAIAGGAAENHAFYTTVLGMRLVKKTVNFDDPGTYHLYYGDGEGRPGGILTFFPWANAVRGRSGAGMVAATALEVPEGSLDAWRIRLIDAGIQTQDTVERFGEEVLAFEDPHGLSLEFVASERASPDGDASDDVSGFHSVSLVSRDLRATATLLTDVFGFSEAGETEDRLRFRTERLGPGSVVDVLTRGSGASGRMGAGAVHHVAFRVDSEDEQRHWKRRLEAAGYAVTPIRDRQYFKSIYFREPGGILFEIATDPPGFLIDEALEELGSALKLPPWLEPRRDHIEARLQDLSPPN